MSSSADLNETATVEACTPSLCPELALPASMTPALQTILQCVAFALVVLADCLHLLFLVRAARTAVYNRSTITVLCLLSATQITFATANAPLVFLLTGWPETVSCKLAAFVTAWWRSATSSFLLLSIWQQYAGQITILAALCAGPKAVELLRSNTSEASRRLSSRFPISSPIQVVNAAVLIAIFSLLASVYTVVLFDSTAITFKDYRLGFYFRMDICSFDSAYLDLARPIFMVDFFFSWLFPLLLASICLSSMRQLPRLASTLFAYNKIHLRIVLKQLSTSCCDLAVPIILVFFFACCTLQHSAISMYRLWAWERWPYGAFPKCQRSADVIVLLYPPVCAVLLHIWCRDLVRKENGLYDPGPSMLSVVGGGSHRAPHVHPQPYCESPDYLPITAPGPTVKQNVVTFSPTPEIHHGPPSFTPPPMPRHHHGPMLHSMRISPPTPDAEQDLAIAHSNHAMFNGLLDYCDNNSLSPDNHLLTPNNLSPDYMNDCQSVNKAPPFLVTIETSL